MGQIRQRRFVMRLGFLPVGLQPSSRRSRIPPRILQGRLQTASQQERACGRPPGYHPSRRFHSAHEVHLVLRYRTSSRANHPAPFPVELPKRCIEMYSFTVTSSSTRSTVRARPASLPRCTVAATSVLTCQRSIAPSPKNASAKHRPWTSTTSWFNPRGCCPKRLRRMPPFHPKSLRAMRRS